MWLPVPCCTPGAIPTKRRKSTATTTEGKNRTERTTAGLRRQKGLAPRFFSLSAKCVCVHVFPRSGVCLHEHACEPKEKNRTNKNPHAERENPQKHGCRNKFFSLFCLSLVRHANKSPASARHQNDACLKRHCDSVCAAAQKKGSDETWLRRNRYLIVAAFQGNFNPRKEEVKREQFRTSEIRERHVFLETQQQQRSSITKKSVFLWEKKQRGEGASRPSSFLSSAKNARKRN